jgi:hypothetical protein
VAHQVPDTCIKYLHLRSFHSVAGRLLAPPPFVTAAEPPFCTLVVSSCRVTSKQTACYRNGASHRRARHHRMDIFLCKGSLTLNNSRGCVEATDHYFSENKTRPDSSTTLRPGKARAPNLSILPLSSLISDSSTTL